MRKVPITIAVEENQRDEIDSHPYTVHLGRSGLYRLAMGEFLEKSKKAIARKEARNTNLKEKV